MSKTAASTRKPGEFPVSVHFRQRTGLGAKQIAYNLLYSRRNYPLPRRTNWSRPLPQPLLIPDVMLLATLADVRELMRHLPEDRRALSTWRRVAADIEAAAAGGDIEGAAVGLRMVLFLERVECRPR